MGSMYLDCEDRYRQQWSSRYVVALGVNRGGCATGLGLADGGEGRRGCVLDGDGKGLWCMAGWMEGGRERGELGMEEDGREAWRGFMWPDCG